MTRFLGTMGTARRRAWHWCGNTVVLYVQNSNSTIRIRSISNHRAVNASLFRSAIPIKDCASSIFIADRYHIRCWRKRESKCFNAGRWLAVYELCMLSNVFCVIVRNKLEQMFVRGFQMFVHRILRRINWRRGEYFRYPLNNRLGGPRSRPGCFGPRQISLLAIVQRIFLGLPARSAVALSTELS
jgi:hypothetical protein